MNTVALTATARSPEQAAKHLRKTGQVPCVLYGNDIENTSLQCTHKEILKAYSEAGKSTLVELDTGSKKVPVLFHEIEFHPVSDKIIHVDFYAVDMKKEIEAQVPIKHEGEAPAVKELGGILITPRDHVTVKCLPSVLPHEILVNIEQLAEFGSTLTIADLQIPDGVKVAEDPGTVIATVQEPRKEEVIEAPVESTEGEAGSEEGSGDEKAEGGEGGGEVEKKENEK
ncbi:50S ribosomal protein L25 [Patescibacteria group bacterium]|nr:50S ribosomal protein L25 [Patescibacteria group bacterium]MBU2259299.1 50S ribosomal protein L25 [Patescibacteria group bacterium]